MSVPDLLIEAISNEDKETALMLILEALDNSGELETDLMQIRDILKVYFN